MAALSRLGSAVDLAAKGKLVGRLLAHWLTQNILQIDILGIITVRYLYSID